MQKLNALEILGWFGGLVLILAYALNSTNVIDSQTLTYQGLNLTGSLALAYYTYRKKAYPNVALNLIWAGVGIFAIAGILNGKSEGLSMETRTTKSRDYISYTVEGKEKTFAAKSTDVLVPGGRFDCHTSLLLLRAERGLHEKISDKPRINLTKSQLRCPAHAVLVGNTDEIGFGCACLGLSVKKPRFQLETKLNLEAHTPELTLTHSTPFLADFQHDVDHDVDNWQLKIGKVYF